MRKIIIGHFTGNDKGIAFCRKYDPFLKAKLQQQLAKDKLTRRTQPTSGSPTPPQP